ncbi:DUF4329 domain-containing protein [Aestuariivita sp.]|jgi:hypothetical protein|uniref:DUF4329 domain-containing protein n=1 Tax=Aestuariivita sp. TaxID=1872407 RepID=UPI00216E1CCA|nr:DUF4329 domain-containing protein [Aestuariivita sp.]MCE8008141.1 DUF4329 domain-containing protein [Aestuariivita sp.]
MIRFLAVVFTLVLASTAQAQSKAEIDLAKQTLRALQERSVQGNREYCGLIGRDAAGRLVVVPARRGTRARCRYPDAPQSLRIVATYHTHGAFLRSYDNEVPSVLDVLAEVATGTNGYVSTPGGRFWYINGKTGEVRLICGPKCLPWDPRFVAGLAGPIAGKYTLNQLRERQLGW